MITSLPTASPAISTICDGGAVALSVGLGAGETAQWESSPNGTTWTAISGATNASYSAAPTGVSVMYYHAVVSNSGGVLGSTNPVQVNVNPTPTATLTSSASAAVCAGTPVTLTATTNASSPTYEWYNNGTLI